MTGPVCALCSEEISPYSKELHHVVLDANKEVDICDRCSTRLADWHAEKLARLFPTKQMKRFASRRRRDED